MYCTHSLSHSKSLNAIVQTFSGDLGAGLFIQFGRIQRACLIEKRYIKQAIPATWYEKPKKETTSAKAGFVSPLCKKARDRGPPILPQ
jgi:E3 ubiquitin-protein ligase HUWE1